jgi:hypothetical protein
LIDGLHASHHAIGRLHSNASDPAFAKVLLHFKDYLDRSWNIKAVTDDFERLIDGRQLSLGKLDVHRGACNLDYASNVWHK